MNLTLPFVNMESSVQLNPSSSLALSSSFPTCPRPQTKISLAHKGKEAAIMVWICARVLGRSILHFNAESVSLQSAVNYLNVLESAGVNGDDLPSCLLGIALIMDEGEVWGMNGWDFKMTSLAMAELSSTFGIFCIELRSISGASSDFFSPIFYLFLYQATAQGG
jgi:hypothetical protein